MSGRYYDDCQSNDAPLALCNYTQFLCLKGTDDINEVYRKSRQVDYFYELYYNSDNLDMIVGYIEESILEYLADELLVAKCPKQRKNRRTLTDSIGLNLQPHDRLHSRRCSTTTTPDYPQCATIQGGVTVFGNLYNITTHIQEAMDADWFVVPGSIGKVSYRTVPYFGPPISTTTTTGASPSTSPPADSNVQPRLGGGSSTAAVTSSLLWAVVGGVAGFCLLVCCLGCYCWCCRTRRRSRSMPYQKSTDNGEEAGVWDVTEDEDSEKALETFAKKDSLALLPSTKTASPAALANDDDKEEPVNNEHATTDDPTADLDQRLDFARTEEEMLVFHSRSEDDLPFDENNDSSPLSARNYQILDVNALNNVPPVRETVPTSEDELDIPGGYMSDAGNSLQSVATKKTGNDEQARKHLQMT